MHHMTLFDFDGKTYEPRLDAARLGKQLVSVLLQKNFSKRFTLPNSRLEHLDSSVES